MKCWKCGKLDHMKKNCHSKLQEKREKYVGSSKNVVINNDESYVL